MADRKPAASGLTPASSVDPSPALTAFDPSTSLSSSIGSELNHFADKSLNLDQKPQDSDSWDHRDANSVLSEAVKRAYARQKRFEIIDFEEETPIFDFEDEDETLVRSKGKDTLCKASRFHTQSPSSRSNEAVCTSPSLGSSRQDGLVECWGHRGASADYPENTIASFVATCLAGADAIETDLHTTKDGRLVMFHDPELDRTTDGKGRIDQANWVGELEHVRTKKSPRQPIPLFSQVLDLLMEPENMHIKLNLDCKVENDPDQLFTSIKTELQRFEEWQVCLAPRLILGLWHPKFIIPAKTHLPLSPKFAISMSLLHARQYFWPHVSGFSIWYPLLNTAEGHAFRKEAMRAGKDVVVWTVNEGEEVRECMRWGVRAVVTDKPGVVVGMRDSVKAKPHYLRRSYLSTLIFPESALTYNPILIERESLAETEYLEREGGTFKEVD